MISRLCSIFFYSETYIPLFDESWSRGHTYRKVYRSEDVEVLKETSYKWGVHLYLNWQRKTYTHLVAHGRYDVTVNTYMLHLIGCTILIERLRHYIDVKYIGLFIEFGYHIWAWECVILNMLHHYLEYVTNSDIRHMRWYISLL